MRRARGRWRSRELQGTSRLAAGAGRGGEVRADAARIAARRRAGQGEHQLAFATGGECGAGRCVEDLGTDALVHVEAPGAAGPSNEARDLRDGEPRALPPPESGGGGDV